MKTITIVNISFYDKQLQYYCSNRTLVLKPRDKVIIDKVFDETEIAYYNSLNRSGFEVCVKDTDDSCNCSCKEGNSFKEFTDYELKTILNKLCPDSKLRARWKIEREIRGLLPEGSSLRDYL